MAAVFFTSVAAFISTNLDDIFMLTLFFAQAKGRKGALKVVAGQYIGMGCLAALSILGALGTQLVPQRYVGLLGFVPLCLGIKAWMDYRSQRDQSSQSDRSSRKDQSSQGNKSRQEEETSETPGIGSISVALVTMANGGDNIGVYIPVFSGYSAGELAEALAVFAMMTALWCRLGYSLGNHPGIKEKIERYRHILVPLILSALGVIILAKSLKIP